MDIPTSREIDLETLVRQRNAQVAELTDEVTRLRKHISTQPVPPEDEPISLPPAFVSALLPHITNASSGKGTVASSSSSVTAALTQRTRLLQEENNELYGLLASSVTGKLKEEVRGLRRVVDRLEIALQESHQVIANLSSELDKSYDTFMPSARQHNKTYSQSPHNSYHSTLPATGNGNAASKLPPTGPRAHKKQRVSESQTSPPRSDVSLPSTKQPHGHVNSSRHGSRRAMSPRPHREARPKANHIKMEVDDDPRMRPHSPAPPDWERGRGREGDRSRTGDRDRELEKEKEKEKEKDRDRDRMPRRNGGGHSGHSGGHGGRGGAGASRRADRGASTNSYGSGDRTLAERMGL